jgi:hypothetical protein
MSREELSSLIARRSDTTPSSKKFVCNYDCWIVKLYLVELYCLLSLLALFKQHHLHISEIIVQGPSPKVRLNFRLLLQSFPLRPGLSLWGIFEA